MRDKKGQEGMLAPLCVGHFAHTCSRNNTKKNKTRTQPRKTTVGCTSDNIILSYNKHITQGVTSRSPLYPQFQGLGPLIRV